MPLIPKILSFLHLLASRLFGERWRQGHGCNGIYLYALRASQSYCFDSSASGRLLSNGAELSQLLFWVHDIDMILMFVLMLSQKAVTPAIKTFQPATILTA